MVAVGQWSGVAAVQEPLIEQHLALDDDAGGSAGDDPAGALDDHLPESVRGRTYYRPSANGEEAEGGDG